MKKPAMRRETVLQGEVKVSSDPLCELSTILGSCVAACLYDPESHVGGMNHFLLGEPAAGASRTTVDEHFGLYLMEVLINEMLKIGASRRAMRAHLYGGAKLHDGLGAIGAANAEFARKFLKTEQIPVLRSDLGGNRARRLGFRPHSGQVKLVAVAHELAPAETPASAARTQGGDVEFF